MCDTGYARQIVDRFNYSSRDGADAVIDSGGGLVHLISGFLGEPIRGAFAAPGDVVLARNGDGNPVVGLVVGHHVIGPGPEGLVSLPVSAIALCWRV